MLASFLYGSYCFEIPTGCNFFVSYSLHRSAFDVRRRVIDSLTGRRLALLLSDTLVIQMIVVDRDELLPVIMTISCLPAAPHWYHLSMVEAGRARRKAAHEITVDESASGQRVDNFLTFHLKGVPRPRIYRLLRRGEVRVNRGRVRPHYRLALGDVVRIPPVWTMETESRKAPTERRRHPVERAILYEDDALIVLNKPAGWAVHGGSGIDFGVIECLRAARPAARRIELVHRIDRDTSGCLLVAKRRSMLASLHEALRKERVRKRYLALVRGNFGPRRRRSDARLLREQRRTGERIVRVHAEGKASTTNFVPVEVGSVASLIVAQPRTGRTHQIRVHAAHLGMPLAGDEKYGDYTFNRLMRSYGLKRLFLHAASISIGSGEDRMTFEAPLGPELASVLDSLGFGSAPIPRSTVRPPCS